MGFLIRLKTRFEDFAAAGFKEKHNQDFVRNILITTSLSLAAFLFIGVFFLEALFSERFWQAVFFLALLGMTAWNYLYLRSSGNYIFCVNAVVYLVAGLNLFLLFTGGVGDTGPLWFYVFPPLAFYVQGYRKGLLSNLGLMGLAVVILLFPGATLTAAHYSAAFKVRFLGSLAAVMTLSFMFEYSRHKTRDEMEALIRKMDKISLKDPLTHLPNRLEMKEKLQLEMYRADRSKRPFALVICDVLQLKLINDAHGHECGDRVLKATADIIQAVLRKQDVLSRWSGKEFLVLLPDTDMWGGEIAADRMRRSLESLTLDCLGDAPAPTVSFGVHTSENRVELDAFLI